MLPIYVYGMLINHYGGDCLQGYLSAANLHKLDQRSVVNGNSIARYVENRHTHMHTHMQHKHTHMHNTQTNTHTLMCYSSFSHYILRDAVNDSMTNNPVGLNETKMQYVSM